MRNMKPTTKKDLERQVKRKKKQVIFLIIVLVVIAINMAVDSYSNIKKGYGEYKNETILEEETTTSKITDGVIGFTTGILETDNSFFVKLLILLGFLYLLQISLHIAGDTLKLTLVLFVAVFRFGKYIHSKIAPSRQESAWLKLYLRVWKYLGLHNS